MIYIIFKQPDIDELSGWKAVPRGAIINFDLETTPLEIKTNSALKSGKAVSLWIYDDNGKDVGTIGISWQTKVEFWIGWCGNYGYLDKAPVTGRVQIWKISLTKTDAEIRIHFYCNGVELKNLLLSSAFCNAWNWKSYWSRKAKKIKFHPQDTATLAYRAAPGELWEIQCF
jgi:hypothetical protein